MWEAVDLREIRVFLVLAEELHFGRTAERLGLSKSRVSQSVQDLEHKLGVQLLHRTSRSVALTPLGERFQDRLDPAYAGLARVLEQTHATSRRVEGTLRLGLLYPTAGGQHMSAIISAFERRHPGCEVALSELLFDDPLGPLRRGEVDVIATRLPLDRPDLVVGPVLSREPRVLEVARGHRLAEREQVSIEDLADYFVAPLNEFPAETVEAVIPRATPSGRPIRRRRLRHTPRTPYEVEALVARGSIVHPTVRSFAEYFGHPDIVHVPISDMPPSKTGLVWRRRASEPRLREFIRTARGVLRSKTRAR
jgi:DNA-binding transcriptional LysR family regulator